MVVSASAVPIAWFAMDGNALDATGHTNDGTIVGGVFDDVVADAGGRIFGDGVAIAAQEANWGGLQLRLTAVPEPSGCLLATLALAGLCWLGRRHREV